MSFLSGLRTGSRSASLADRYTAAQLRAVLEARGLDPGYVDGLTLAELATVATRLGLSASTIDSTLAALGGRGGEVDVLATSDVDADMGATSSDADRLTGDRPGCTTAPRYTTQRGEYPTGCHGQINSDGTNHRDVWADEFDPCTPDPGREAPPGSDLAEKRAASRAASKVPCQSTYKRVRYNKNSVLDRLMDRGICWHYNAEIAANRSTAYTLKRCGGAVAYYGVEDGRLRFVDRYGQHRLADPGEGDRVWDPAGHGKPVDEYTSDERDEYNTWRGQWKPESWLRWALGLPQESGGEAPTATPDPGTVDGGIGANGDDPTATPDPGTVDGGIGSVDPADADPGDEFTAGGGDARGGAGANVVGGGSAGEGEVAATGAAGVPPWMLLAGAGVAVWLLSSSSSSKGARS